ncbi:MAG: cytochrome-c peroxidase [Sulfurovum sp.]
MYRALVFIFLSLSISIFAIDLIPIDREIPVDSRKVELGKMLFFDTILSKDKTLSCNSCHDLATNGADNSKFSMGIDGKMGTFNSPTVYNAVYNFRQFWDGRSKNLKTQALGPIINPAEMGNTIVNVLIDLKKSRYKKLFLSIYEDGVTEDNLADAIAEFEKTLITPNSPFDKYLKGDKNALTKKALRGYKIFKRRGCIYCHNGINIGGNIYNKFGVYESIKSKELGRYNITHKEEDKYMFKVPSLRNVAITAPYMHDGRSKTLKEAINLMSKYQLGRVVRENEMDDLIHFLKSLTGEIPKSIKDINETE